MPTNNVEEYLKQILVLIIVSQGASLTQEKPDKEKEAILWGKIREVFQAGHSRFNSIYEEFRDVRTEQKIFKDLFELAPITKEQWDTMSASFPLSPTTKELDDNYKEFKKHQTTCRNTLGVLYAKLSRVKGSGEYDDRLVLTQMIKKAAFVSIDLNHAKASSKFKVKNKLKEDLEELIRENEIELTKTYDNQKLTQWENCIPDVAFLAHTFLGACGSNNCAIVVPRNLPNHDSKTRSGRKSLLKDKNSSLNSSYFQSESQASGACIDLKKEELKLKSISLGLKERQNRYTIKNICRCYYDMLL